MDSDIPIFQHQQTVFSRPLQNRAKVNYFCTCETLQKLNGRTLQSLAKLAKIWICDTVHATLYNLAIFARLYLRNLLEYAKFCKALRAKTRKFVNSCETIFLKLAKVHASCTCEITICEKLLNVYLLANYCKLSLPLPPCPPTATWYLKCPPLQPPFQHSLQSSAPLQQPLPACKTQFSATAATQLVQMQRCASISPILTYCHTVTVLFSLLSLFCSLSLPSLKSEETWLTTTWPFPCG